MTPEATRNLLIRRRELTGETFNDHTIKTWGDLLAEIDYTAAVAALNQAVTEHERVNARHLHEHLPTRRTVEQAPIGNPDCDRCEDAAGFVPFTDRHGTRRMMPCPGCRPTEAAKVNLNADYPAPVQFAITQPAERAAREAHESSGIAAIRAIKADMGWH